MVILLFFSVLALVCYLLPATLLRKFRLVDDSFAKHMAVLTLYVTQCAMFIHGFIYKFDKSVFLNLVLVFLIACGVHLLAYFVVHLLFKKTAFNLQKVLRFGIVFSNAGYMGIPVITDVFGAEYAIYATGYIVAFNLFAFTLGRLIYTEDKKYVSFKKAIFNPAVISIIIGLIIYVTGLGGIIQICLGKDGVGYGLVNAIYNVLGVFKNMVAPVSMMVIGARLADTSFKGIWKDKNVYLYCAMRLFVIPILVWLILLPFYSFGLLDYTIYAIILILSSTPGATLTTMFAELYDGDAAYSGKLVALTTLLSVITMPTVSLLLNLL